MADQEVIKHTKKVYKIWNSSEHSFWFKVKEFVVEILIIVFAVTLSIYLHSKSEYQHDQEEVKRFLIGLKSDLQSDVKEMKNDIESYKNQSLAFSYLSSLKKNEQVNLDSLNFYKEWIFNKTWLLPNNGRYEGFKSSGNIDKIENIYLRDKILDLYQEDLPTLLIATSEYVELKNELFNFLNHNRKRVTDSTTNINDVFKLDVFYNYSKNLREIDQIENRYNVCIEEMNELIREIERVYK